MTRLDEFDFELPAELIAQEPSEKRDYSKLLIADFDNNHHKISNFYEIIDHLRAGDLMIFNNSRVINAQLTLTRYDSEKPININLNRPIAENKWLGFARPAKKLHKNDEFNFDQHQLIISEKFDNGEIEIEFCLDKINIFEFLDQYGQLPLPQYIKRSQETATEKTTIDQQRYQNVYSQPKGSVAAPTAGLHFTNDLLDQIKQKGVNIEFVTLHVGAGTFLPVKTENIHDHKMHTEWCEISPQVADAINNAKKEGRRVIVVGTTSMRTVESCAQNGLVQAGSRQTDIFITPGYDFQIADMLITNFHLPKSTLFMLVCAFAGQEEMKSLYQYAINHRMRFFSYGDSMILSRKKFKEKII